MESFTIAIQVIGSLASILGIPLAIYLFLRQRESKFRRLRDEILDVLSRQVGEGRSISLFELQSVIETKTRDYRIRRELVSDNSIIEDLVTETVRNPMLVSEQKKGIITNLQELHSASGFYERILRYESSQIEESIQDFDFLSSDNDFQNLGADRTSFSQIFAVLVAIFMGVLGSIAGSIEVWGKISEENVSRAAGIGGVVVSVLAAIGTYSYVFWSRRSLEKTMEDARETASNKMKKANKAEMATPRKPSD